MINSIYFRTQDDADFANRYDGELEYCETCSAELYVDEPGFTGGKIDGLYLCFTHYLAEVESLTLKAMGVA